MRLGENTDEWLLEHMLVTIQHRDETAIMAVCATAHGELQATYDQLRKRDRRWAAHWQDQGCEEKGVAELLKLHLLDASGV